MKKSIQILFVTFILFNSKAFSQNKPVLPKKWGLETELIHLYFIPQFGILSSITSDMDPRGGESDTFIQGNLFLGINF